MYFLKLFHMDIILWVCFIKHKWCIQWVMTLEIPQEWRFLSILEWCWENCHFYSQSPSRQSRSMRQPHRMMGRMRTSLTYFMTPVWTVTMTPKPRSIMNSSDPSSPITDHVTKSIAINQWGLILFFVKSDMDFFRAFYLLFYSVADPEILKPGARYNFWGFEVVLISFYTNPMLYQWE